DPLVTGVQTCALPIFPRQGRPASAHRLAHDGERVRRGTLRGAVGRRGRVRPGTPPAPLSSIALLAPGTEGYLGYCGIGLCPLKQIGRASCREMEWEEV